MANKTTTSPTSEIKDVVPYWMILIWGIAGVLVLILIIVAIYYSYVICCQQKKRKHGRSYGHHQNPRNATENYPQAFIEQLHIGDVNSRSMFSPSFVDHMRIPRAMEVKIVESVNSLNKPNQHPAAYACSPPSSSPILENDYLNTDVFANHKERMPPSREQSFRYQTMTTEESKERIYRERLLVSELREKLRNQRKIDE